MIWLYGNKILYTSIYAYVLEHIYRLFEMNIKYKKSFGGVYINEAKKIVRLSQNFNYEWKALFVMIILLLILNIYYTNFDERIK